MTDPQLEINTNHTINSNESNDNNNADEYSHSNNNNNNIENQEPKYLHKKFKKIASSVTDLTDNAKLNEGTMGATSLNVLISASESKSHILNFEVPNTNEGVEFRKSAHICPHCNLSCSKPSVLQKHIRAHTNERPYLCGLCGFAFKTKSNLNKHCRSRAHKIESLKIENDSSKIPQISSQLSEESDASQSDSTSSSGGTPLLNFFSQSAALKQSTSSQISSPNPSPNSSLSCSPSTSPRSSPCPSSSKKTIKIYKPKFHTVLQQCSTSDTICGSNVDEVHKNKKHNLNDQGVIENLNPKLQKFTQHKNVKSSKQDETQKHHLTENLVEALFCPDCKIVHDSTENVKSHQRYNCKRYSNFKSQVESKTQSLLTSDSQCSDSDFKIKLNNEYDRTIIVSQPQSSPGPLLGNTRLIDSNCVPISYKRPRLDLPIKLESFEDFKIARPNSVQMFGGEVQILDKNDKDASIKSRTNDSSSDCPAPSQNNCETTSILVRSSLHSGGTMLHKPANFITSSIANGQICTGISLSSITPNISPPSLAPTLSHISCFDHSKTADILYTDKFIPHVPGMPGPQSLQVNSEKLVKSTVSNDIVLSKQISVTITIAKSSNSNTVSKFLRPCTLSLEPGTFKPKRHHGITPTANTLPLISPETPRPKKSYGQLYLNGHAYTYLDLKCSTRVFYCTLNRTQPIYVTQQQGISMYSNWKICNEILPDYELAHFDSRHRPAGYTVACNRNNYILTHSSQYSKTPSIPDNGSKNNLDKKRTKVLEKGFIRNDDYTNLSNRDHGNYKCEECGVRFKKLSLLREHLKTHSNIQLYMCKHCDLRFKTKDTFIKHMKAKAHYEKCIDSKISVITNMNNDNINKHLVQNDITSDISIEGSDTDGELDVEFETENEVDSKESKESVKEVHEIARSLLKLAQPKENELSGILSLVRPSTYPYALSANLSSVKHLSPSISEVSDLQNTLPQYYNLPSENAVSRLSVIRSCGKQETSVPIDLTTKSTESKLRYTEALDISNNTSGPALLHSIVQTMERLPVQSCEQSQDYANGPMLQTYLTERYMMDNKMKQQYRILSEEKTSNDRSSLLYLTNSHTLQNLEKETELKNLSIVKEKSIQSEKILNQNVDLEIEQKMPLPIDKLTDQQSKKSTVEITEINTKACQTGSERSTVEKIWKKKIPRSETTEISDFKQHNESVDGSLNLTLNGTIKKQSQIQKVVVGTSGFQSISLHNTSDSKFQPNQECFQPTLVGTQNYTNMTEDTRNVCNICNKVFSKPSQLSLHINIHYFERPFRCESCGTSFRTKDLLTRHLRSTLHHNKVSMTSTFGAATSTNPRPFKCTDCKSAFRIYGHLSKHRRSKIHIMRLECLGKIPFGTYAEIEKSGININDIDISDYLRQLSEQKSCSNIKSGPEVDKTIEANNDTQSNENLEATRATTQR